MARCWVIILKYYYVHRVGAESAERTRPSLVDNFFPTATSPRLELETRDSLVETYNPPLIAHRCVVILSKFLIHLVHESKIEKISKN